MHDICPYFPDLFTQPGRLLYIGARLDAHSWLDEMIEVGHKIVVLEAWHKNFEGMKSYPGLEQVVLGNVLDTSDLGLGQFDYVMWWHGPEHLYYSEMLLVLKKLEAMTSRLVLLACPWGLYPQGPHEGNYFDIHRFSIYPYMLKAAGYQTVTDGAENQPGSEIVAWKRFND